MHGAAPLEKALAQAVDGRGRLLAFLRLATRFPASVLAGLNSGPVWRKGPLHEWLDPELGRKPAPPPEVLAAAHGAVSSSRAVLGSGRNELQPPSKLDSTALGKWSLYSGHKTRFSE